MDFNPLVAGSLIPVLISGTLVFITGGNRFGHRARLFALLMAFVCVWSAVEALIVATPSLAGKFNWTIVQYVTVPVVPVLLFLVVMQYTGHENRINVRNIILLLIVPLASFFLVWTNNYHHLFYSNVTLDTTGTYALLSLSRGPLFWMHVVYSYSLIFLSILLLLQRLRHKHTIYRLQAVVFLVAIMVTIITSVVYVTGHFPIAGIDPSPFSFAISGLIMAIGIFKYRLLDIVPVVREQIIESIAEIIVVCDDNGRLIDCNQRAMELFTWDKAAIGQPLTRLWQNRPALLNLYTSSGSLDGAEISLTSHSQPRYYQISTTPVIGRSHNTRGTILVFHDITGLKQAEENLRQSNARFKFLVDYSYDLIWMLNSDGVFLYVSPSWKTLLGYEPLYMTDKAFQPFVHPDDVSACEDYMARVLDARQALPGIRYRVRHAEGTWRWHEGTITPVFAGDGSFMYFVGVSRDITEQLQEEQQIRDSESRLQSLVRIIQHKSENEKGLLNYTLHEAIRLSSSEIGYIYFYDEEKKLFTLNTWSTGVMDVCSITQPQTVYELEKTGIWGEAVRQRKEIVINNFQEAHPLKKGYPEGHAPLYKFMSVPVFSGDQIVAVVGVANKKTDYDNHDVLQLQLLMDGVWKEVGRTRAEEEKQAAYENERHLRESLEEEIKKRVDFTRVLVHELKTPLVPIIANSDILASELQEGPWAAVAQGILRSGENLGERIDELLDLARGEIGMLKINPTLIDPARLLSHIVAEMTTVAQSRRHSLTLDLPEHLSEVLADGPRLRQVINNLINNAFKYTPSGGVIHVAAYEENNQLNVEVQDNGPGLTEEDQVKIFKPYERLGAADSGMSGLGLGLALCKNLVELHGGKIWVKSRKGEGSTFGFSIPVTAVEEPRNNV